MSETTGAELWFDGSCEPNNPGGWMSWAWTLNVPGAEERIGYGSIEPKRENTNNQAEYIALGKGIRAWVDAGKPGGSLLIRGDSQLVVKQLNGEWACRKLKLARLLERCKELLSECEWRAEWVPREQNERADALTRQSYEETTGRKMPERHKKVG